MISFVISFIITWYFLKTVFPDKKTPYKFKVSDEWKELMKEFPQWFNDY